MADAKTADALYWKGARPLPFLRESLAIEGIYREPTEDEILATQKFLAAPLSVDDWSAEIPRSDNVLVSVGDREPKGKSPIARRKELLPPPRSWKLSRSDPRQEKIL